MTLSAAVIWQWLPFYRYSKANIEFKKIFKEEGMYLLMMFIEQLYSWRKKNTTAGLTLDPSYRKH